MHKPIALFGGGNDGRGKQSAKIRWCYQFSAKNAIVCTVRDCGSRDYLIANGVDPDKVHLFPDPAVLLEPCSEERAIEIMRHEGIPYSTDTPFYGLVAARGGIVSDKSFSSLLTLEEKHQARVHLWVTVLTHLLHTTNAHFVFIPHCIGPTAKNDDRRMSRDIFNALPGDKKRITLIEHEYSPGELKGLLKKCTFLLGERTHALIGAASVGTPCVALTVEEDLRMHHIVHTMFKQITFNLNAPDITELNTLLTREWTTRALRISQLQREAFHLREEALRAASLLKESIAKTLKRT
jgi:polysaccharide pyruvyl transferase WcaK-like protein